MTDIYIMYKMLLYAHFSLLSVITHYKRDTVETKKANRVFGFPLLLTAIFRYCRVDVSSEQKETTDDSDITSNVTISRSGFKFDKNKKQLTMKEKHEKRGPNKFLAMNY